MLLRQASTAFPAQSFTKLTTAEQNYVPTRSAEFTSHRKSNVESAGTNHSLLQVKCGLQRAKAHTQETSVGISRLEFYPNRREKVENRAQCLSLHRFSQKSQPFNDNTWRFSIPNFTQIGESI